jgi:hypothetical protein
MSFARCAIFACIVQLVPPCASGQAPSLRLEHTLGLNHAVSFGEIADGALAPDGGVVLVDGANVRVYRFTAAGVLRDSLGRRGGGPGEMRVPAHVVVMRDGQIIVGDLGRRALIRWDAHGRRLPETSVTPFMTGLFSVGSELLIASRDWRTDTIQLFRFGANAAVPHAPQVRYLLPQEPSLGQRLGAPASSFLIGDDGRTIVAVADTFYRLTEVTSTGRPVRSWSRPEYPVARWTDAERTRLRRNAGRLMSGAAPEAGTSSAALQTKFTIPIEGLGLDGLGRLWVMPQVTGDAPRQVDVFADDGRLLASHTLAGRPKRLAVRGDLVLAWGETEDGEPAAWVYRIH